MKVSACQWCGNFHAGVCPRVRLIEYFETGAVKRVEFHEVYLFPPGRTEAPRMGEPISALNIRSVE